MGLFLSAEQEGDEVVAHPLGRGNFVVLEVNRGENGDCAWRKFTELSDERIAQVGSARYGNVGSFGRQAMLLEQVEGIVGSVRRGMHFIGVNHQQPAVVYQHRVNGLLVSVDVQLHLRREGRFLHKLLQHRRERRLVMHLPEGFFDSATRSLGKSEDEHEVCCRYHVVKHAVGHVGLKAVVVKCVAILLLKVCQGDGRYTTHNEHLHLPVATLCQDGKCRNSLT